MDSRSGYGTVAPDGPVPSQVDAERAAMLNKQSRKDAFTSRCADHLNTNVTKSWGDVALLGCYLITGLLDGSSISVFDSFASMQTGNTVYLGLGLVAPSESDRWLRALISIACFCLGSFFFSTIHRNFSPCRRWVLVGSFLLQTIFVLIAALMSTLGPEIDRDTPLNSWVGVSLALLAFQSAGQAVASRALQYSGLTSVVLTSNYCDLFSDPNLFKPGLRDNPDRNRRTAAPILLLSGALIGGAFAHTSPGLTGALWTAAGLKAVVVVAWAVWAPEKPQI